MFSNISEHEIAKIFVYAKEEKIKTLLGINILDTYTAAEILFKYIYENKDTMWNIYQNKYDSLFDEIFFMRAVNVLKDAHTNGKKIDNYPTHCEAHITYVS